LHADIFNSLFGQGTEKEATGHCEQSSVFLALNLILNIMYISLHVSESAKTL